MPGDTQTLQPPPGQDQQDPLAPPSIKRSLLSAIPIIGPILGAHSLYQLELKRRREDQQIAAKAEPYKLASQFSQDQNIDPDTRLQWQQLQADMAIHNEESPTKPYAPDLIKRHQSLLGQTNAQVARRNLQNGQSIPAAMQPPQPGGDENTGDFSGLFKIPPPPGAATGMLPQGSSQVSTAPGRPPVQPQPMSLQPPPQGMQQSSPQSAEPPTAESLMQSPIPELRGAGWKMMMARGATVNEAQRAKLFMDAYKESGAEQMGIPFVQFVETGIGQKPTAAPPVNVNGVLFSPTGKVLASVPQHITTPQGAQTNLYTPNPVGTTGQPLLNLQPPPGPATSPNAGSPNVSGTQTIANVPPMLPPEQRVANSFWEGINPGQKITPDKYAEAMAKWKEQSDPLGTQVKKSTLSTQESTRATQAMNRAVMQNEMDIAQDPDVIGYAAQRYRVTGQMPQIGMGSKAIRASILRTAATQAASDGNSGEADALKAQQFKADSAALNDITKRKNQIGAFEKTAGKNLDVFLQQAKGIVDSGSPMANRVFRGAQRELTGGLEGFDAARITAFTEISRVLSGAMGSQLSDSARHEAETIIKGDYTIQGLMKAAQVLRTDMKNRMDSFDEQINQIRGGMGDNKKTAAPATLAPPPGGATQIPEIKPNDVAAYNALPRGTKYTQNGTTHTKR